MKDTRLPFEVMEFGRFLQAVVRAVNTPVSSNKPAFAMLLGAGFSSPLIPSAHGMLQDIPWWLYSRMVSPGRPFDNYPSASPEFIKFSRSLWSEVRGQTGLRIEVDPASGLPVANADNTMAAYQGIMNQQATCGLCTHELQNAYFRDAFRRIGNKVNLAHLFLGGILHAQCAGGWRAKRAFCRSLFTTNIDALLQRSLQLHGQLYVVSDQPDVHVEDPTDEHEDIQLFYTHGSVYRPFVANSQAALEKIGRKNTESFRSYFGQHGVIVIGYGGWPDSTMQALQRCKRFQGQLFWCDIHDPELAAAGRLRSEVLDLLAEHRADSFYVPLPEGGADSAMQQLHDALGLGPLPKVLVDPLAGAISSVESLMLSPNPDPPGTGATLEIRDASALIWLSTDGPEDPFSLQANIVERLKTFQRELSNSVILSDGANHPTLTLSSCAAVTSRDATREIVHCSERNALGDSYRDPKVVALTCKLSAKFNMGDFEGALSDGAAILNMDEASIPMKAAALLFCAALKGAANRIADTIVDCTTMLGFCELTPPLRRLGLLTRGAARSQSGDAEGAIRDYTEALDIAGITAEQKSEALMSRARVMHQSEQLIDAIIDYTEVVKIPGCQPALVTNALLERARIRNRLGDKIGAIADFSAIANIPKATPTSIAKARIALAGIRYDLGNASEAKTEYTAVINTPGFAESDRADALFHRGWVRRQEGDTAGAIEDFSMVVGMSSVSPRQRATALAQRAILKARIGDFEGEDADYSWGIAMPDASDEAKAWLLLCRGASRGDDGRPADAMTDFTAVIEMTGATAQQKSLALDYRTKTRLLVPGDMQRDSERLTNDDPKGTEDGPL